MSREKRVSNRVTKIVNKIVNKLVNKRVNEGVNQRGRNRSWNYKNSRIIKVRKAEVSISTRKRYKT